MRLKIVLFVALWHPTVMWSQKSEVELLQEQQIRLTHCATFMGVIAYSDQRYMLAMASFEIAAKLHGPEDSMLKPASRLAITALAAKRDEENEMLVDMLPFCLAWMKKIPDLLEASQKLSREDVTGASLRAYLIRQGFPSKDDLDETKRSMQGDFRRFVISAFNKWEADGSPQIKVPDQQPEMPPEKTPAPAEPVAETRTCLSASEMNTQVQKQLRSQLGIELAESSQWNEQTDRALRSYLKILLELEPWKEGWTRPADTDYTDEVSAHLHARLKAVETELGGANALTENLRSIVVAMDCLKAAGAYPMPIDTNSATPEASSSEPAALPSPASEPLSGNAAMGVITSFANGVLYEFADEAWCKFLSKDYEACHESAKQDVLAAQAKGGLFTAIVNFIGVLLSPLGSYFALLRARSLHKTGGSAFWLGFRWEAFENGLMAFGEIATFGRLQYPEDFFKFGLAACVVTGILVAARAGK